MFCVRGIRELAGEIMNEAQNKEKDPICNRAFYKHYSNE